MSENKVAMISGHTDLTPSEFETYYRPKIDNYIAKGYSFVLGGAEGADKLAQLYLASTVDLSKFKVTVYDKGQQNNVHDSRFEHVNGFSSYPERDAAMTAVSSVDICILRQKGGAGSGTAANIYRRAFGDDVAKKLIKLIRSNSMPYDDK